MSQFSNFDEFEFSDNPDPRCPVVLILDVSSSMAEPMPGQDKTPLQALNDGLDVLVSELNKDPLAKRRVELSIVTYGTDVTPATKFATVDNVVLPTLVPSGTTSTGQAVEVALDAVEDRKKEYKANGISYFRPMLMILTDGLETSDSTTAVERLKEAEQNKKVSMYAVGVEGADMESLAKFSPARPPVKLQGLKFDELFVWLSASQAAVSASNPGDSVPLPSPAGWAEF